MMQKVFESIYFNKIWYKGSGSGSLPSNTKSYRNFLEDYIRNNKIKKIIDIGCGNWSFSSLINWFGLEYLGIDVVRSLIGINKKKWSERNIRFQCGDALKMKLPGADLVIIKDVLQHWPNNTIAKFLPGLKKYEHVLIINSIDEIDDMETNGDIRLGQARPVDLSKKPFKQKVEELFVWESWRPGRRTWESKSVVKLMNI